MLSMTGYGRGEFEDERFRLTVEAKSVNNRYLDVAVKAPRIFTAFEDVIRTTVRKYITRGHVDVFISFSDRRERAGSLRLDEGLAKSYASAAARVKELFPKVCDDFSVTDILRFPEVLKVEENHSADDESLEVLKSTLVSALESLNKMRTAEGEKLRDDMLSRVSVIEKTVKEIKAYAPKVAENYRAKLEAKIKSIVGDADEGRILTEAALFADKCNIDEELTRLFSHIDQFRAICKDELVGRKLDFLIQEFNREANTVCSKSNDLEITRCGLALKNEIEKIREQVQNVE